VIVNVGGFSITRSLPESTRERKYERVAEGLEAVEDPDVELLPQTMPPFPWHLGGQHFHNLFVDPDETVRFCTATGRRICLDVSHAALSAHHLGRSLAESISILAPHVSHLHLADATGVDGEGLQIGEGDTDFAAVADALEAAPDASFIPEVWQGHKERGSGFWVALDRLERWF
jgi:N-acetylneuraminate synthase